MGMKIHRIRRKAAQGDILIRRVAEVPEGATAVDPENDGGYVVAHSETGHHHVALGAKSFFALPNGMQSYLVAKGPITIEHRRPHDTHEPMQLLAEEAMEAFVDGGEGEVIWEIRRQREYTPEGLRRVED